MKTQQRDGGPTQKQAKVAKTGSKVLITRESLKQLALKEAASPDGLHERSYTEAQVKRIWPDLFSAKERTAIAYHERLKETLIGLQKTQYKVMD